MNKHERGFILLMAKHKKLVGPVAAFCFTTVEHGVFKVTHVAGGFPDTRVHDDGAIKSNNIFSELCHRFPPAGFNISLHFNPERAVIPEAINAAVDFGRLKNKTAPFAETYERIHRYFIIVRFHKPPRMPKRLEWVKCEGLEPL